MEGQTGLFSFGWQAVWEKENLNSKLVGYGGLATLSCQKLLFMVTVATTLGVVSSVTVESMGLE